MDTSQRYIGTPNGVVLCVDSENNGQPQGRLYHFYKRTSTPFHNLDEAFQIMDDLFDTLNFPQRTTNVRTFAQGEEPTVAKEKEMARKLSEKELAAQSGDLGTFVVRVQHRQNSSWQGRVSWLETNQSQNFRSALELLKLIESGLDTVSAPERTEPTWANE